jgi:succinate dehydrogenase/fumarate reductase flavoprotein subunit
MCRARCSICARLRRPSPVTGLSGGAQVSRTFYARGQTGQQLLLGAYSALNREINRGSVKMFPRTEMLKLVLVNGKARELW